MTCEIEGFIKDAIAGGWGEGKSFDFKFADKGFIEEIVVESQDADFSEREKIMPQEILLDPLAWQAVSKTRGWDWAYCYTCKSRVPLWGQCECDEDEQQPEAVMAWHRNWTRFIDHLADGKTIEQALLAIK